MQNEFAQEIGNRIELALECVIAFAIDAAVLRHLDSRATLGGKQVAAIERGDKILRAPLDNLQSVRRELEIGNHLGVQQAHRVGGGGVAKARQKFFRDCGAADDAPSFQDFDLQPRHGEIGGTGEPVVTRTDDDDVISLHIARSTAALCATKRLLHQDRYPFRVE